MEAEVKEKAPLNSKGSNNTSKGNENSNTIYGLGCDPDISDVIYVEPLGIIAEKIPIGHYCFPFRGSKRQMERKRQWLLRKIERVEYFLNSLL